MDIIPLTRERRAQLDDYAQRHGQEPAAALDEVLANYLEFSWRSGLRRPRRISSFRYQRGQVSPACCASNHFRIALASCFDLGIISTRKAMLQAQFFEKFTRRLRAPGLHVLVASQRSIDRIIVVLPLPLEPSTGERSQAANRFAPVSRLILQ